MKLQKILYEVNDGIAFITMNYAKNLNAIDEQMADELYCAFDWADQDTSVKVVVLQGSERAFSAGGDIGFFYDRIQAGGTINLDDLIARVGALADKIKRLNKIVITSVCGPAAGAGASLALSGDFMICEENAKILLAFVNLGLAPDTGATYLLSKSIGAAKTMELAATGRPIDAKEAQALGIAYQIVPKKDLGAAVLKLASKFAQGPLVAYQNIKKQIYDASFSDYTVWLKHSEAVTQKNCAATIDFKEGCRAFIEKRKAKFSGR